MLLSVIISKSNHHHCFVVALIITIVDILYIILISTFSCTYAYACDELLHNVVFIHTQYMNKYDVAYDIAYHFRYFILF